MKNETITNEELATVSCAEFYSVMTDEDVQREEERREDIRKEEAARS